MLRRGVVAASSDALHPRWKQDGRVPLRVAHSDSKSNGNGNSNGYDSSISRSIKNRNNVHGICEATVI